MIADEYKDCLTYIDSYWKRIIKEPTQVVPSNGFIKLPRGYITPNDKKFSYLFYWDTYFMFRGLIGRGQTEIMKDVLENYIYLLKRYGIIPNFNSHASTNRSQPPFFSSMIMDVYRETRGKKTLARRMEWAKWEYENVWVDRENSYNHHVDGYLLSKYGDRDVGYAHTSELESGWDFTSRFYNRCNEFLPVDLNCLLLKYELDFAREAEINKNSQEQAVWKRRATLRAKEMNALMWNEAKGFFFDYNHKTKKQSSFMSLAGFTPLWVGLATQQQAQKMIQYLDNFESKYGLFITDEASLPPQLQKVIDHPDYHNSITEYIKPKQWDYPNIWPPVEYLTVVGLLKYGFLDEAKRIMKKSLAAEAKTFRKHHMFFEKRNGLNGDMASSFHYAHQGGFGWTNAEFYRYVQILIKMEQSGDESIYKFPMSEKAPYELDILV